MMSCTKFRFPSSRSRPQLGVRGQLIFSSPGRSPGRAIIISPASVSVSALAAAAALAKC